MAELGEEEESILKSSTKVLETGSRIILIAYGVGFFVESYFDAKYGVTYLNPFRSRIAYTGIGLLLQIAFIAIVLNAERIWGLNSSYWYRSLGGFANAKLRHKTPFIITWLTETAVLGFIVRFLFAFHIGGHVNFFVTAPVAGAAASPAAPVDLLATLRSAAQPLIAGFAIFILLTACDAARIFGPKSKLARDIAGIIAVVTGLVFVWAEWSLRDPLVLTFTVYILIVRAGLIIFHADPQFQNRNLRLGLILVAIVLPTYYAQFIYPNVLPQWGGAANTKMWIKFERDIIPFGVTSPAYLLEETEEGYYLLRPRNDPDAAPPPAASGSASSSPEAEPSTVPPSGPALTQDKDLAQHLRLPDPNSYSAIYVPRREITEVLYERADMDGR